MSQPETLAPGTPLRAPLMGSYLPDDVAWLVRDATDLVDEVGLENIHLGPSNANTMPVEDAPTPEQIEMFRRYTRELGPKIATAVGVVSELALQARGSQVSFASIIRAGLPVGVLAHRWLARRYKIAAPHYAISIVPGDGIDPRALAYLAEHHDPAGVVFMDGWTGRGNITLEIARSIKAARERGLRFNPELATLIDYSQCTTLFGTREDMLLPSGALNGVATGLTTKTILAHDWTQEGHFHAVARYPHHAEFDQSLWFVDEIARHFDEVIEEVDRQVAQRLDGEPPIATMKGRDAARRFGIKHGVEDLMRVRAGIGEGMRSLVYCDLDFMRVHPDAGEALKPVLEQARSRGIDVIEDPTLEFACVGVVTPIGHIANQT